MYKRRKKRRGSEQAPKPEASPSPGAATLLKVNRGLLSRCRLLRKPPTASTTGPSMTQRDMNPSETPIPTASDPPTAADSVPAEGGNAKPNQEHRSLMSDGGRSQAGHPGRGSGGRSSPGRPDEEEGATEEEEVSMCLERRDGQCVPLRRPSLLRASVQSLSSFRRHSWEPGRVLQLEALSDQEHSISLEDLEGRATSAAGMVGLARPRGRDPRRAPITLSTGELDTWLSMTEEEPEEEEMFGVGDLRHRSISGGNLMVEGPPCRHWRREEEIVFRRQEDNSSSRGEVGQSNDLEGGGSHKVHRTFSFLRRMAGMTKIKEREKLKEREKEAKERETRITNGHLFTSITVSGNTLCFACNKSIITKEAFVCPTCTVTIHKSCKDVLSSCTKVKQKQLKAAQAKNNSALQNVSMRHKAPLGRERPNSAIYPSDSLRQSPLFSQLGSRRARTTFQSLSKSVSTNNIGNLNDDMPLGIRKILSQSTDSLTTRNRTLSIESLIDEGAEIIFHQLMGDLDTDEKDFEADSWSLAVDTGFLQQHRKDVMKRQDVIYELIQTEVHHLRTLKIMSDIFRKGMVEDLQMESGTAEAMFPALDELLDFHQHFLSRLLERRRQSLQGGSTKNFVINRLGDLLVSQFSGKNAELMRRAYTEFCSRHPKAVKLYKELFTRDKRFQQFVRRMTRCSVLRRHGIQECILLVTQRITKYPVLFDRILQNTKGNEEELGELGKALVLVKEAIAAVDREVHESERRFRLQDVCHRMDPRAAATMHSGRLVQRDDLLRRKLLHDGFVLWKTATGRFKDVQVLLLTDVLIFLQEKDQRYSFPALDNKPAVIPLQKLIVRDIANQEKGLFLISAAAPVPEMYEIHTASREERTAWIKAIQHSVSVCPEMEHFSMEIETKEVLRELSDEIQQRDRRVTELLEEKAGLLLQMLQLRRSEAPTAGPGAPRLFRSDSSDRPQGERLITEALREVQSLSELMVSVCGSASLLGPRSTMDQSLGNLAPGGTENTGGPAGTPDAEQPSVNGGPELGRSDSLGDTVRDRNGNQLKSHNEEVFQRLAQLSITLLSLQALVVKQDSLLEEQRDRLCEQTERLSGPSGRESSPAELERLRGLEKEREELVGLRRQHSLLQVEFQRSRRAQEEKAQEARALEARLEESERRREQLERERDQGPQEGPRPQPREEGPILAVPGQKRKAHSRQFSLPSAPISFSVNPTQSALQRRKSTDECCLRVGPWTDGPHTPRQGLAPREEDEGPEGGEAQEAGPNLGQDGPGEERESPSTSSGEEATDTERNVPEGSSGSDPEQPVPGQEGHDPQTLHPHVEDDDDDDYY